MDWGPFGALSIIEGGGFGFRLMYLQAEREIYCLHSKKFFVPGQSTWEDLAAFMLFWRLVVELGSFFADCIGLL